MFSLKGQNSHKDTWNHIIITQNNLVSYAILYLKSVNYLNI